MVVLGNLKIQTKFLTVASKTSVSIHQKWLPMLNQHLGSIYCQVVFLNSSSNSQFRPFLLEALQCLWDLKKSERNIESRRIQGRGKENEQAAVMWRQLAKLKLCVYTTEPLPAQPASGDAVHIKVFLPVQDHHHVYAKRSTLMSTWQHLHWEYC